MIGTSQSYNSTRTGRTTELALCVTDLIDQARRGQFGPLPATMEVTVAFTTLQRSRHAGRQSGYANHLVSLRAGASVGSCFFERGEIDQGTVDGCVGQPLGALLEHRDLPIRIAALDTYLAELLPHHRMPGVQTITVPSGASKAKSLFRARTVVGMLHPRPGQQVALIGVVNSLVQVLRELGVCCLPCDLNVTQTEWGDPVTPDMEAVLPKAEAILATGMTLANGTFDRLLAHARQHQVPLVVFAQTGSAVVPRFLGAGVTGVLAEPYPFFWMTGTPTTIYRYQWDVVEEDQDDRSR